MSGTINSEEIDLVGDNPEDIDEGVESDAVNLQEVGEPLDDEIVSGYPPEFYTAVPSPEAKIWEKFPPGLISDVPVQAEIDMDEEIFLSRKAQFGTAASAMISQLLQWSILLGAFDAAGSMDWVAMPVTFFAGVFLNAVQPAYFAEFVTSNTNPYFMYLVLHPEFRPNDLLRLPRVAKTDVGWGIYMSLFTDKHGNVVAWYVGSATGFGSVYGHKSSGIIGRMISYYTTPDTRYTHGKWLHDRKDLEVRFVKIAGISPGSVWQALHRIYTLALETLIIVMLTFNTALKTTGMYRHEGTADWVDEFRQQHGLPVFSQVQGLNHALPLKQGIRADIRFSPEKRRCSNPAASCPAGTEGNPSKSWKSFSSGQVFSGEFLCGPCYVYRANIGVHRPQSVIDQYEFVSRKAYRLPSTCYWCFRDFPPTYQGSGKTRDRTGARYGLDVCGEQKIICHRCYDDWHNFHKRLSAIPGVHIPADHRFECQSTSCSLSDKTMALKWFFTASGDLECQGCHYPTDATVDKKQLKSNKSTLRNLTNDSKLSPHKLCFQDVKLAYRSATGKIAWYLHCEAHLGFDSGSDTDTDAVREQKVKAIQDRIEMEQNVDDVRRAEWFGEQPPPSQQFGDGDDSTLVASVNDENTLVDPDDSPIPAPSKGKSRARKGKARAIDSDDEDDDEETPFVPDKRQKMSAKSSTKSKLTAKPPAKPPAKSSVKPVAKPKPVARPSKKAAAVEAAVKDSSSEVDAHITTVAAPSSRPRRKTAASSEAMKLDYTLEDSSDEDYQL